MTAPWWYKWIWLIKVKAECRLLIAPKTGPRKRVWGWRKPRFLKLKDQNLLVSTQKKWFICFWDPVAHETCPVMKGFLFDIEAPSDATLWSLARFRAKIILGNEEVTLLFHQTASLLGVKATEQLFTVKPESYLAFWLIGATPARWIKLINELRIKHRQTFCTPEQTHWKIDGSNIRCRDDYRALHHFIWLFNLCWALWNVETLV